MKNPVPLALTGGLLLAFAFVFLFGQRAQFAGWISKGELAVREEKGTGGPELASLPAPVQTYLGKVLPVKKDIQFVMLKQSGSFWTAPGKDPSSFDAVQYTSVRAPSFSWTAHIQMTPVRVIVVDRLVNGEGALRARVLGLYTVQDASGKEILKGELLRYLAEIPWAPQAILYQKNLFWKPLDATHVELSTNMGDVRAKVVVEFGADGLISRIRAEDRPFKDGDRMIARPWQGMFSDYKEYKGVLLPSHGEVSWILDAGTFRYYSGDLEDYAMY